MVSGAMVELTDQNLSWTYILFVLVAELSEFAKRYTP